MRSAAAILPSTFCPCGRPNISPSPTRTAGAMCTATFFLGLLMASKTCSISDEFGSKAPVGQTRAHCPQDTHSWLWPSSLLNAVAILERKPRNAKSMAPIPCTSLQMRTQLPHKMHLLWSRTNAGEVASLWLSNFLDLKRISVTSISLASFCSLQLLDLLHRVQSWLPEDSSNSRLMRRKWRISSLLTRTFIPSRGLTVHEATMPIPSTSTRHSRQAP